jgi:hypothetical protein
MLGIGALSFAPTNLLDNSYCLEKQVTAFAIVDAFLQPGNAQVLTG